MEEEKLEQRIAASLERLSRFESDDQVSLATIDPEAKQDPGDRARETISSSVSNIKRAYVNNRLLIAVGVLLSFVIPIVLVALVGMGSDDPYREYAKDVVDLLTLLVVIITIKTSYSILSCRRYRQSERYVADIERMYGVAPRYMVHEEQDEPSTRVYKTIGVVAVGVTVAMVLLPSLRELLLSVL